MINVNTAPDQVETAKSIVNIMAFQRVTMISFHSPELFLRLLETFLLADPDYEGRI